MSRIIAKLEQGTDEWLKQRIGMMTATRSGQLHYGASKNKEILREMVREFIGEPSEIAERLKGNPDVKRGSDFEDTARFAYLDETGFTMEENSLYFQLHDDYDWLGASPDGIVIDDDGNRLGIEIKCPRKFTLEKGRRINLNQAKKAYYGQIQHFMQICDLGVCDFIEYVDGEIRHQTIDRDEKYWSDHFPKLEVFMEEYNAIINDENESDKFKLGKDLERADERFERLIELKTLAEESKSESDSIKKELYEEFLENKPYHGIVNPGGYRLFKQVKTGSINNNAIVKTYQEEILDLMKLTGADIEDFRNKGSESLTFTPPRK
jgi:putative phage-type endonuclease